MVKDFALALSAFALAAAAHASGDECVYDQANQLEKLQSVAAAKPHARVVAEERLVAWTGRDKTRWSLVYGGCSHLSFAVTSSKMQKIASKPAAVLQAANRMAAEFWDRSDAADLKKAIAQGKFVKRTDATASYFSIAHESYDVFEIVQEFKDGTESVTVRWVRSF